MSGKGIPASLFMAVTRNLFRIIAQQDRAPEQIATQINDFLTKDNERSMFVTMFIGVIDLKTGHLDFCNCGHNPPVLVEQGKQPEFMSLKYDNQPLGLWEGDPFLGESIEDIRNKQLFIYTDGLNEAEDPDHKQFGNEAILDIMSKVASSNSREIIDTFIAAVEAHRKGADPNDDLTLLCLRLKEES